MRSFSAKNRGSVNGGFQTMVPVWPGEQIPAPQFKLNVTLFLPLSNLVFFLMLTPAQPASNHSLETKPRFADPFSAKRMPRRTPELITSHDVFSLQPSKQALLAAVCVACPRSEGGFRWGLNLKVMVVTIE